MYLLSLFGSLLRARTHCVALTVVLAALMTALTPGCKSVSLDQPIESRTWWLDNLAMQPVIPSDNPKNNAQITFDQASVKGWSGCSLIRGTYSRAENQLRISSLATTQAACASKGRSTLERNFLAALHATAQYHIYGTELELVDASGHTLATLTSAPLH
ncbi:MAG: META domain-containing protein [Burkholderiaceae bacterium]|nr:META domain-containing protein [Burkholderiaceae bacterium]